MNKKLITYLVPIFIGTIILLGIFYFVSLFTKGDDKKEASLKDFKGTTEIFSSKKEAYDVFISDSIVNVRKENVSVDLNALFSSHKKEESELIPDDGTVKITAAERPVERKDDAPVTRTSPVQKIQRPSYSYAESPKTFAPSAEPVNEKKQPQRRESFNSFSQSSNSKISEDKTAVIRAVVHSKQTVYNGSTVKLRAASPFTLNGVAISENTIIYGVVSMMDERVLIQVNSINLSGSMVPVSLRAYDRDGMEGVYIPGLAQHELKNESVDQAITEAQTALNVPRIASGALNVARNRNRQAAAILTDNYQLILK